MVMPLSVQPAADNGSGAIPVRFPCTDPTNPTTLAGHLYLPQSQQKQQPCPAVIVCMGLGLTQASNIPLHTLRDQLLTSGNAILTFDYRTFGESEGTPRHQVKPQWQLQDIQAAINFLQKNDRIQSDRIGLWGTSLGGGHVLATAASTKNVKAVVSLVPHTRSALETAVSTVLQSPWTGTIGLCRIVGRVVWGLVRSLCVGATTYLPLHGPPGSVAMMQTPGDDEGYGSIAPSSSTQFWHNAATIGSVPAMLVYRPISQFRSIRIPTLLLVATHDTLCPTAGARRAAQIIPGTTLVEFSGKGHFDVYQGDVWDQVVDASVKFLEQQLC